MNETNATANATAISMAALTTATATFATETNAALSSIGLGVAESKTLITNLPAQIDTVNTNCFTNAKVEWASGAYVTDANIFT
jgi:hypothetical protein